MKFQFENGIEESQVKKKIVVCKTARRAHSQKGHNDSLCVVRFTVHQMLLLLISKGCIQDIHV